MTSSRLIDVRIPERPDGVVLVLHGGASKPHSPMVSPTQLSVIRMIPIARKIARVGGGRLAVIRLLNSVRGWDAHRTPVDDVNWALEQVGDRFGAEVPVGLVGHSLGGRAALLAASHERVRSAVALNPWVYPTDGRRDVSGRQILIVHGDADRIADPRKALAVADDLRKTAMTTFVSVRGGKHAMLRRAGTFSGLAADFTASVLLDQDPSEAVVASAVAGQPHVDI